MKGKFLVSIAGIVLAMNLSAQTCNVDAIEETASADRFINHQDGTVTDVKTGLMWSKCSVGQTFSNGSCSGNAISQGWNQALQQVQTLNGAGGKAGYADWRLPNINELASIVEFQCFDPAIQLSVFPATPSETFWSSTPDPQVNGQGRSIYFMYGSDLTPEVEADRNTRLVRDSQ